MNTSNLASVCGLLCVLLLIVPSGELRADDGSNDGVPHQLTHQGRLVDDSGHPMVGELELTYTIYDRATDGDILWQDVVDIEPDTTGFYSVEIGGSDNPVDPGVVGDGRGWLGVAVDGGDEMEPRISLNSVPFALRASEADVARSVVDGSIGAEALDSEVVIGSDFLDQDLMPTLGTLACDAGDVPRYDGVSWYCHGSTDGVVEAVTASSPLTSSGGAEPEISLPAADGSTSGYLGAEDFTSFDERVTDDDPRLSDPRSPTSGSSHYIHADATSPQDAGFYVTGDSEIDADLGVGAGLYTSYFEVGGPIRFDTSASTRPGCESTTRGSMWFAFDDDGDRVEICVRRGDGSYVWEPIGMSGAQQQGEEIFAESGQFTVPSGVTSVDVAVVAGGGGGGARHGGGGGGGGVVYETGYSVSPGEEIAVVVGEGGAGGVDPSRAESGEDSVFGDLVADGGGGGGGRPGGEGPGLDGGSGGGGGTDSTDNEPNPGGSATQPTSSSGGYGNDGGHSWLVHSSDYPGGGGGGAGQSGSSPPSIQRGGRGGNGMKVFDRYVAGGGGGATHTGGFGAVGGTGGGGDGGDGFAHPQDGSDGEPNTGGGGGGGTQNAAGGQGGSGVVIVRWNY